MAGREHSRSVSALNRLIFLAILIPLAVIAILYFTSAASPFHAASAQPAAVTIGMIKQQYKLETAEVTSSTLIDGSTSNALPFSKEDYVYQVVVTMTAGVDMSVITDTDITTVGGVVTIKLPSPTVLRVEQSGQVVSHESDFFAGLSADKNLLDKIQTEGRNRVTKAVLDQGTLMQEARQNAEDDIRTLLLQAGYTEVKFVEAPTIPPTPLPSPSAPPS